MALNLGTSLEAVERAMWTEINSKVTVPTGSTKKVLQEQSIRKKGSLKDFDVKIIFERIYAKKIPGRGQGDKILVPIGIASVQVNDITLTGPAEYQKYSQELWFDVMYQARYLAKTIALDRKISEGLLRLFADNYFEVEEGVKIFIRQFEPLATIKEDEESEIFERAITWAAEVPLKVEPTNIFQSIVTMNFEINP